MTHIVTYCDGFSIPSVIDRDSANGGPRRSKMMIFIWTKRMDAGKDCDETIHDSMMNSPRPQRPTKG